MRSGTRYAIDFGESRIGVAKSDPQGMLGVAVATVKNTERAFEELDMHLVGEILEIYVGLPINLAGGVTAATTKAIEFASQLSKRTAAPVLLVDERLTTSIASTQLKEAGKSQKNARGEIDQLAAVAILEYALTTERNTGLVPGVSVARWKELHD